MLKHPVCAIAEYSLQEAELLHLIQMLFKCIPECVLERAIKFELQHKIEYLYAEIGVCGGCMCV